MSLGKTLSLIFFLFLFSGVCWSHGNHHHGAKNYAHMIKKNKESLAALRNLKEAPQYSLHLDDDTLFLLTSYNTRIALRMKKMGDYCQIDSNENLKIKDIDEKELSTGREILKQAIPAVEKAEAVLKLKAIFDLSLDKTKVEQIRTEFKKFKISRNQLSFCLVRLEIKEILENDGRHYSLQDLEMARNLMNILNWFESHTRDQNIEQVDLVKDAFGKIFNYFWSSKKYLTLYDERILGVAYKIWASFYDLIPTLKDQDLNGQIAFHNLNPHNSSFFQWLEAKRVGIIPSSGLPLLHADTHTDLLHVYQHLDTEALTDLSLEQSVQILDMTNFEAQGKDNYYAEVKKVLTPKQWKQVAPYLKNLDLEKFKDFLLYAIQQNVKFIGQPMIASMASNLTTEYIFSLPPWSQPTQFSPVENGLSKPAKGAIIHTKADDFMSEMQVNVIGLVSYPEANVFFQMRDKQTQILSPDDHDQVIRDIYYFIDPAVMEKQTINKDRNAIATINTESLPFDAKHDSFSPYFNSSQLGSQKFILDIDLDVFSSDGRTNYVNHDRWHGPTKTIPQIGIFVNKAMPFSHERTPWMMKWMLDFADFSHPDLKQLKNEDVVVTSTEFKLLKVRMDQFFERLNQTKINGQTPAIITLTDSSILQRVYVENYQNAFASSVELNDSNFTPIPLVFLINYYARMKLASIYQLPLL
ncbi:MAG: hypothetical protein QE271_13080 [Bacteriovoracaceae bacterium]|nr:hypothetical protein [Bacteriovoracaceae bacterium]